jgi:hypothetical protein
LARQQHAEPVVLPVRRLVMTWQARQLREAQPAWELKRLA